MSVENTVVEIVKRAEPLEEGQVLLVCVEGADQAQLDRVQEALGEIPVVISNTPIYVDVISPTEPGHALLLYGEDMCEADMDELRELAADLLPGRDIILANFDLSWKNVSLADLRRFRDQADALIRKLEQVAK